MNSCCSVSSFKVLKRGQIEHELEEKENPESIHSWHPPYVRCLLRVWCIAIVSLHILCVHVFVMRGGRYMMLWQRSWRSIAEPKHDHYSSGKSWHLGQHLPVAIGVFFWSLELLPQKLRVHGGVSNMSTQTWGWRGTGSRVEPGGSLHTLVPGTGSDTWKRWGEGRLVWSGGPLMMLDVIHPSKFKWSNHFQVQIVMYISETVLLPMHFILFMSDA